MRWRMSVIDLPSSVVRQTRCLPASLNAMASARAGPVAPMINASAGLLASPNNCS
jgi:hypothetical protein